MLATPKGVLSPQPRVFLVGVASEEALMDDLVKTRWRWPDYAVEFARAFNHLHELTHETLAKTDTLSARQETLMADAAAILAQVRANNDALRSMGVTIDALNENQATIADLIRDLKNQTNPDLTELEAEVANQGDLIAGAKAAIGENTATPVP